MAAPLQAGTAAIDFDEIGGGVIPQPVAAPPPEDPRKKFGKQIRDSIAAGEQRGRDVAAEEFAPGALGRLEIPAGLQSAFNQVLDARRAQASEGLTEEHAKLLRERSSGALNRQTERQLNRLASRSGAAGVRGAAATAGQQRVLQEQMLREGDFETQLALQDISARERGVAGLESAAANQLARQMSIQQFNLGQQGRETFGRVSTPLAFGGLERAIEADITGAMSAQAGIDAANQQVAASGGGGGGGGPFGGLFGDVPNPFTAVGPKFGGRNINEIVADPIGITSGGNNQIRF